MAQLGLLLRSHQAETKVPVGAVVSSEFGVFSQFQSGTGRFQFLVAMGLNSHFVADYLPETILNFLETACCFLPCDPSHIPSLALSLTFWKNPGSFRSSSDKVSPTQIMSLLINFNSAD